MIDTHPNLDSIIKILNAICLFRLPIYKNNLLVAVIHIIYYVRFWKYLETNNHKYESLSFVLKRAYIL